MVYCLWWLQFNRPMDLNALIFCVWMMSEGGSYQSSTPVDCSCWLWSWCFWWTFTPFLVHLHSLRFTSAPKFIWEVFWPAFILMLIVLTFVWVTIFPMLLINLKMNYYTCLCFCLGTPGKWKMLYYHCLHYCFGILGEWIIIYYHYLHFVWYPYLCFCLGTPGKWKNEFFILGCDLFSMSEKS